MIIDPLAAEYLVLAYKGEKVVKTRNRSDIHDWAKDTIDNILNRFEYVKNHKALKDYSSPTQSIMRLIIPQKMGPKSKPRKAKKDHSFEFIEAVANTMGGKMNNSESRYDLPESAPNFEQSIATLKLLMQRAFEIQMVPKGLWMYGAIIMLVLTVCSILIMFFNRSYIEYTMAGVFSIFTIYSFFRWRSLPNFKDVAKVIRDLVYSKDDTIDQIDNQK
jgi:hypothetical protein